MMLKVVAAACCLLAGVAGAVEKKDKPKLSPEEQARLRMERTGGDIVIPGESSGHVSVVNLQAKAPEAELQAAVRAIRHNSPYVFKFFKPELPTCEGCCKWTELKKSLKAEVLIVVVDDPKMPNLISAPEDNWAVVNVANLVEDLSDADAKKKFFAPRVRKEFLRAFAYAMGAGGSSFKNNIMTAEKVRELDYCREFIPADATRTIMTRLEKRGVRPETVMTYAQACAFGVAPMPTNEYQKAIYERIRSEKERGPSNALKITPPAK